MQPLPLQTGAAAKLILATEKKNQYEYECTLYLECRHCFQTAVCDGDLKPLCPHQTPLTE